MTAARVKAAQLVQPQKGARLRRGIVEQASPLKVKIEGATTPVAALAVPGVTYSVGMIVLVLGQEPGVGPAFPATSTPTPMPTVSTVRPLCKISRSVAAGNLYYGTGGSGAAIVFDIIDVNDSAAFYTATAAGIQVVQAGVYQVSWRLRTIADGNAGLRNAILRKNGTQYTEAGTYTSNSVVIPAGSECLRLAAGDALGLYGYASTATACAAALNGSDVTLSAAYLGT
jgi:hypothetical protein